MGLCEIPLSPRQARKQDSFDTTPIIQQFKENRNGRFQQKRFYQRSSRCGDFINHGRQLSFCIDGPGKNKAPYDAKGLPTTELGKTGVIIPKMVLGLGSRFCHIDEDEEAYEMLNYALDNGFYYWDTAHAYDNTIAVPPGKKNLPAILSVKYV